MNLHYSNRCCVCCAALAAFLAFSQSASAAPILAAPYSNDYVIVDLGAVDNVTPGYGGLTVDAIKTSQLLIGGSSSNSGAVIDSIGVTRDINGHITGFSGSAQQVSTASGSPSGGIDGGLAVGPGGVLFFTSYSDNHLGEIKPGSSSPDKLINLTAAGVVSSVGSAAFVPNGFANAGHLKIGSYSAGQIYDTTISPDGLGTYDVGPISAGPTTGGGPEGIAFILAGNADFPTNSVLVSEYSLGRVSAYSLDVNSDPIVGSRHDFITGLTGAEGATIDPVTGDFLFSTFGGASHVIEVRGFIVVPEPSALALLGIGGLVLATRMRRARRSEHQRSKVRCFVEWLSGPSKLAARTARLVTVAAVLFASFVSPASGQVAGYSSRALAYAFPDGQSANAFAGASGIYYDTAPPFTNYVSSIAEATVRGGVYSVKNLGLVAGRVTAAATQTTNTSSFVINKPALAQAELIYSLDLLQIRDDRVIKNFLNRLLQVPLRVQAVMGGSQGDGAAIGMEMSLKVGPPSNQGLAAEIGYTNLPNGDFVSPPINVPIGLTPTNDDQLQIILRANAAANVSAGGHWLESKGSCYVDPTFAFDQATFDANAALLGYQTFPLDQYFALEFSPGLDQLGVPEPSSAALLLLGGILPCLVYIRRGNGKRAASGDHPTDRAGAFAAET
jgi:hypothetical protein